MTPGQAVSALGAWAGSRRHGWRYLLSQASTPVSHTADSKNYTTLTNSSLFGSTFVCMGRPRLQHFGTVKVLHQSIMSGTAFTNSAHALTYSTASSRPLIFHAHDDIGDGRPGACEYLSLSAQVMLGASFHGPLFSDTTLFAFSHHCAGKTPLVSYTSAKYQRVKLQIY